MDLAEKRIVRHGKPLMLGVGGDGRLTPTMQRYLKNCSMRSVGCRINGFLTKTFRLTAPKTRVFSLAFSHRKQKKYDTLEDVQSSRNTNTSPVKAYKPHSAIVACFLLVVLFISPLFLRVVYAFEVDFRALSAIESSNNPKAVSFLGAKYGRGLYQVSEIALKDYLQYHPKEKITADDLFLPDINKQIASWLINKRIPQILRHLKRPVTLETVLSAYNKGYKGELAHGYINKYKRSADFFSSKRKLHNIKPS